MAREITLPELLGSTFDNQLNSVYTSIPAIIIAIRNNANELAVDVQPAVNIKKRDGSVTERAQILNVPVQMPTSQTGGLTFQLNIGDPVWLHFSMAGLDTWKRSMGGTTTPGDFRKFDKRDCIAVPGTMPFGMSTNNPQRHVWPHDTKDVVLFHNLGSGQETEIRLLATGGVVINTNQDVSVNCNSADVVAKSSVSIDTPSMVVNADTTSWSGNINHSGNFVNSGSVKSNGIVLDSHVHGGVDTGPGNTGGPQ